MVNGGRTNMTTLYHHDRRRMVSASMTKSNMKGQFTITGSTLQIHWLHIAPQAIYRPLTVCRPLKANDIHSTIGGRKSD